jgi:DNA-binding transcriptional regulator YiaG
MLLRCQLSLEKPKKIRKRREFLARKKSELATTTTTTTTMRKWETESKREREN